MYSKSSSALPLSSYQPNVHNSNNRQLQRTSPDDNELPDLSHLSEAERKIIEAVLERQRADEKISPVSEKSNTLPTRRNTFNNANSFSNTYNSNNFESSSTSNNNKTNLQQCHSIMDIAQECKQRYGSVDTGNVCEVCRKTKFTHIGAGHACFNCKARCCVKCAYKYTTKTKQLWTCIDCKRKQDVLLKSGKWLNNPMLSLNKKHYTSDYILNKAAEVGIGMSQANSPSPNFDNEITNLVKSIDSNFNNSGKKILPGLPTSAGRKLPQPGGGRQLPQVNAKPQMKYNTYIQNSNSAQSVPELTRDDESFSYNQNSSKILDNEANLPRSSPNRYNDSPNRSSSNTKSFRQRQPLLKQASLNNPPTYRADFDDENPYESNLNSHLIQKKQNKTFQSNQELTMTNDPTNNNSENFYFSSNASSTSQLNQSLNRTGRRERLQDPTKILKTIRNSSSHLNSLNNLNDDTNRAEVLEMKRQEQEYTNNNKESSTNAIISDLDTSQKQRLIKTLLHADSLSSDPSDYQSMPNYQSDNVDDNDLPKSKRTTRPRRQPALPVGGSTLQQQQQLKQQLLQKALMKQNLKQYSLTSSDENMIDEFEKNNDTNSNEILNDTQNLEQQTDFLEDDDEIRSTTEYTTNDEMDLESGSVSIPAHTTVRSLPCPGINLRGTTGKQLPTIQSKSIDDYLVQNLKKEEILAAKMSKFLSPTNWNLSTDGKRMVGHIILKRNSVNNQIVKNSSSSSTLDSSIELNSSFSLGIKVIGGKLNPITNQLSAYVVKIRKDSISETVGKFQVGDEILKWNGHYLRGLTYDEVYAVMSRSRQDLQVEIFAERLMDEMERGLLKNLINEVSIVPDNIDCNSTTQFFSNIATSHSTATIDSRTRALDSGPIGSVQLKIYFDKYESRLYVNVLNICLKTTLCNQLTKTEVDLIYCSLDLMVKIRSDQFKRFSEVCSLDRTTENFHINEAFTFEPFNSFDLNNLIVEFEVYNNYTKDPFGKLNIEYSPDMFDNQLLNHDIMPIMTNIDESNYQNKIDHNSQSPKHHGNNINNDYNMNRMRQDNSRMSIESLNSNGANTRRKLPQLPPAKQLPQIPQQNQEKTRQLPKTLPVVPDSRDRYSISDSEAIQTQYHSGHSSFNQNNNINQSSPLYTSNEQLTTKNQVRELQQEFDLYNNNNNNSNLSTPKAPQKILPKPLIREKNQKVNTNNENLFLKNNDDSPLHNSNNNNYQNNNNRNNNKLESNAQSTNFHLNENNNNFSNKNQQFPNKNMNNYNSSDFYNGFFNGDSDMYGSNNSNNMYSNSNVTSNNVRNNNISNSKHLSPSPSPPLSMQQQNQFNNNNSTTLPSSHYHKSPSRANNFSDFDGPNYNNNKPNRQNINNSMNSSYLNSSSEFIKPTPLIDESMKATTKGPEKLFSARNLNQKINPAQNNNNNIPSSNMYTSNTNLNNVNANMVTTNLMNSVTNMNNINGMNSMNNMNNKFSSTPPANFNKIQQQQNPEQFNTNKNNGLEFDDEGSLNSQYSCVSKLSSNSIQSDLFKGANNGRKRISNSHLITNNPNNDKQIHQQQIPSSAPSQAQIVDSPVQPKAVAEPPKQQFEQPKPVAEPKKTEKKPKTGKLEKGKTSSTNAINSENPQPNMQRSLTGGAQRGMTISQDMNPTHTFFLQYANPSSVNSKNNSTMSLPGQSMQNLNKITKVGEAPEKPTDGAMSDSATATEGAPGKKRRPSMAKALVILGLSKKSNSTNNLALGKRFGFARSEEVGMTPELRNRFTNRGGDRDASAQEENRNTETPQEPKPKLWSGGFKLPHESPYHEFIENLGPGQKVSRQVLGLPCLGEVKLSIYLDKEKLTIELPQAKNLKQKTGYKFLPMYVYIKLYLFNGTACSEKRKTSSQKRTLNPTFNETLRFETSYRGTLLQLTCWGNYGKLDSKVFMGVAQIVLDDLTLTRTTTGLYKLFPVSSIITDFSAITPASELLEADSSYSMNQV